MTGAALQGAQQSGMGCGRRLLFDQPPAGQDHRPHVQKHSVPEAHTTEVGGCRRWHWSGGECKNCISDNRGLAMEKILRGLKRLRVLSRGACGWP